MEKRDALILLLMAGAVAYGTHANWHTIRDKLGLEDQRPGNLQAIELAKNAKSLDKCDTNAKVLKDRDANGEIKVEAGAWRATELADLRIRVTCKFSVLGEQHVHRFVVDNASGAVSYEGLDQAAPAPR